MSAAQPAIPLLDRIGAVTTLGELEQLWPDAILHEHTRNAYHERKFVLTGGRRPVNFAPRSVPAPPAPEQAPPPPRPNLRGMDPAEIETFARLWGEKATLRTLADVSDDPPGDLLFGFAEPAGPTLAYGAPGVGKGMTGAWMCCEALNAGMRPMVYDAERRPREWARRVSGLGGDRSRVVYLEPTDLHPGLAGRPLWEIAPYLGSVARRTGSDLLLIDSIMPAVGLAEERLKSDASVPFRYVTGLEDELHIPSISFGHPPKGQPEGDPFGSFAWVAAMRLTWLATTAEGEGHRIRWRPRKRNERGHIPGILLTVEYGDDGRPCTVTREDDEQSTRDAILAALVHGPRTVSDLADEIVDEIENPAPGAIDRAKESLGRALRRMAREGWVERLGAPGSHNVRWALRLREDRP